MEGKNGVRYESRGKIPVCLPQPCGGDTGAEACSFYFIRKFASMIDKNCKSRQLLLTHSYEDTSICTKPINKIPEKFKKNFFTKSWS